MKEQKSSKRKLSPLFFLPVAATYSLVSPLPLFPPPLHALLHLLVLLVFSFLFFLLPSLVGHLNSSTFFFFRLTSHLVSVLVLGDCCVGSVLYLLSWLCVASILVLFYFHLGFVLLLSRFCAVSTLLVLWLVCSQWSLSPSYLTCSRPLRATTQNPSCP